MAPVNRGRGGKKRAGVSHEVPKFQSIDKTSTDSSNSGTNMDKPKINLNDYEEVEDEYGFIYMKKKQKILAAESGELSNFNSTPTPMIKLDVNQLQKSAKYLQINNHNNNINNRPTADFSPSTPTPSKQILENNRKKRRSSFAVVQNSVRNSFGMNVVSLQSSLPPENVKTSEYHRHLQPEMPGPVKMRQLMIWACQKASKRTSSQNLEEIEIFSSKLIDGLLNNEISTSWYQRPANTNISANNSIFYTPNPQNQELSECIQLYKNYHMKLEKECEIWESFVTKTKTTSTELEPNTKIFKYYPSEMINNEIKNIKIDNTLNVFFAEEFQNLNKWLHSLPMSIDRLDWNTKLALSFQDHAKQFCEGVFHQIFAKFFAADLRGKSQRLEPMMILRALSSNSGINASSN